MVGVGRGGEGEGVAVLALPPPSPPHPQGLTLGEPLTESDAVRLSTKEGVGAEDTVALGEVEEVEVGMGEALPVLENRAVAVAAPLPVTLAVTLVPLPREVVGVGVEEGVPWTVQVLLRVLAPLPVPACGVPLPEGEEEAEWESEEEGVGVVLLVAVELRVGVGSTVPDARAETVCVAENEDRVTWGVREAEEVAEGEGLMEYVAVRERDTVLGGEGVAVMVPSPDPLALGDRVDVQVSL